MASDRQGPHTLSLWGSREIKYEGVAILSVGCEVRPTEFHFYPVFAECNFGEVV